jgi:hypothetical protein
MAQVQIKNGTVVSSDPFVSQTLSVASVPFHTIGHESASIIVGKLEQRRKSFLPSTAKTPVVFSPPFFMISVIKSAAAALEVKTRI